jgi:hypothetical protein
MRYKGIQIIKVLLIELFYIKFLYYNMTDRNRKKEMS